MPARYYLVPEGVETAVNTLLRGGHHVVFLGEVHEREWIVSEAVSVLRALCDEGRLGFLALEHFNVEQQELLDSWLGGSMSWRELVEEYGRGPEGFNLEVYRPLLEAAASCGARIVGVMPPRDKARVVSREGRMPWLPEGAPDPAWYAGFGPYRALLESLFPREGPMASIPVESLVLAQSYKDSVAAWVIARMLSRKTGMAVMGWVHVEARGGVATRLRELVPWASYLVIGYREQGVEEALSWYRRWQESLETRVLGFPA